MKKNYRPETIAIMGNYNYDPETGATNVPIYLSNAYQFKSADSAANLFNLTEGGYIYTRLHNPTTSVLEERINSMEDGCGAVATATGHFAEVMLMTTLCGNGDEFIASSALYGGTANMFSKTFKRFGIDVQFVDQSKPENFEAKINAKTKAIYIESISNPLSNIADFMAISAIAKKHKLPLVIDNTYGTPYLFKAKEFGADIVLHSTTKFICGHASAMGGIVVDLGTFDWSSGRFPQLTEPNPSYHGLKFYETFGSSALAVMMRVLTMRDLGGTPSPFNSYMTLVGLQTLPLRMDRHLENAMKVAKFLQNHPKIEWVNYPSLEGNQNYPLAKKYFPKGAGSIFAFGVKGGSPKAKQFIESVKLCLHATNLGDIRTILTHPASTTHRQLSAEDLAKTGITDNMIRISVGIEHVDDIIEDIENGLK